MDRQQNERSPVRVRPDAKSKYPVKTLYKWRVAGYVEGPEPYRALTPDGKRSPWGDMVEHKKLAQLRERMKNE